ncbi:hypothetical protein HNQ90_003517 [Algibacter amylolyticus]|nr:hypothetical protein [Algibacter amylolyticus]
MMLANKPALGIVVDSPQPDDRKCEDLQPFDFAQDRLQARPFSGNAQILFNGVFLLFTK